MKKITIEEDDQGYNVLYYYNGNQMISFSGRNVVFLLQDLANFLSTEKKRKIN